MLEAEGAILGRGIQKVPITMQVINKTNRVQAFDINRF